MKKIYLAQAIGVIANIGVVAGILLLAVELNQNNDFLAAQARHDQLDSRNENFLLLLSNPEVIAAFDKFENGETLTPAERFSATAFAVVLFHNWEWQYDEFRAGTLAEDDLPINGWRNWYQTNSIISNLWEVSVSGRSLEFVSYFEANVIAELPQ